MKILDGIPLWGDDPDDERPDGALAQLKNCAKTSVQVAGMADRHQRLSEVLKAHEGLIKVLHVLKPIGVAMAGIDTHDPYKD